MSLRQYWRDVKHRFNHHMFENFPAERVEAAEGYAKAAYASCLAWYGPPLDAQKPYCVAQAVEGSSFCKPMFGKYYLAISKEVSTPERLCSVIAHEMYHRVTAGVPGRVRPDAGVRRSVGAAARSGFVRPGRSICRTPYAST